MKPKKFNPQWDSLLTLEQKEVLISKGLGLWHHLPYLEAIDVVFPRLIRHKIKRIFFDFHNYPGSCYRLQNEAVFDCNKPQCIQRFHVWPRFC
jgi:hypothetical protein